MPGGWLADLLVVAALAACAHTEAPARAPSVRGDVASFAVVALSRGRGVPAEAREGLQRITIMLENDRARGVQVETHSERIGIEGDTRLCIRYESAVEGQRARKLAEEIARGIDLLHVVGPCPEAEGP